MAVVTPFVLQAGSHSAEVFRRTLKAQYESHGILTSTALAVTPQGTPNMTVNVALGEAVIFGTEQVSEQGAYQVYNDATVIANIGAANATNPRNDLVVYKIEDAEYSGSVSASSIVVVPGTPAPTPVDPPPPPNYLPLARVRVDTNATSITSAKITDLRPTAVRKAAPVPTLLLGKIGYQQSFVSINNITTVVDLMSVSATVGTSRRIRVSAFFNSQQNTTAGLQQARIQESTTVLQESTLGNYTPGEYRPHSYSVILTPSAGSHTYKLTLTTSAGSANMVASGTQPAYILVEDIGVA